MRELEKELEGLPETFVVGVMMPNEGYEDTSTHLMSYLVNRKKASGGYVSISKPHNHIVNLLKGKGINLDNIHFIDCITKSLGVKLPEHSNCVFIESPAHLTELSVALHEFFISSIEKDRFLYIDSISTLGIHNKPEQVLKFIHYITGKMRIFNVNGMILSMHEESDEKLKSELGSFCDKVIHL